MSASVEGFTLRGAVNPNGGATTYHFDFGITEAYGQSIPSSDVSVGSGTSPVAVSQLVKGLPPSVPYHYRVVAHNAGGTSVGEDQFFITPAEPQSAFGNGGANPIGATSLLAAPSTPPSNTFTARTHAAKAGGAALSVSVPGPGVISISGRQVKAIRESSAGPGTVSLTVKLTAAGKKALKAAREHRLPVKLTIVFQPAGGRPATSQKTIVFK